MSIYTNDIDTLRQMISQSFPQLLSSVITIVSVLVSMLILNVPLTFVTLLMVAIMLTASRKLAGLSGKYFLEQQTNLGIVNGYIEEMMEGQKVVKVFCHEDESIQKFDELNDQLFASADNANRFANILMPVVAQWKRQLRDLCHGWRYPCHQWHRKLHSWRTCQLPDFQQEF